MYFFYLLGRYLGTGVHIHDIYLRYIIMLSSGELRYAYINSYTYIHAYIHDIHTYIDADLPTFIQHTSYTT